MDCGICGALTSRTEEYPKLCRDCVLWAVAYADDWVVFGGRAPTLNLIRAFACDNPPTPWPAFIAVQDALDLECTGRVSLNDHW